MAMLALVPPLYERPSLLREALRQLGELRRFGLLIRYMVSASLRTENTGTLFGYFWWLLDPLLLMAVYVVLIDVIMDRGGEHFPLFVFTSVLAWKYFSASARNAMGVTLGKERLMKQISFPKAVLPISALVAETIHFGFGLVVLLVFSIPFGVYPHPALALVPLVALVQLALTLGFAFFLSALNVFFRDLQNLSQYVFRIWFYLSPGLYAITLVPERYRDLYELNPFATLFPAYHAILLDHQAPDFQALGIVAAFSVLVLFLGYLFFVRLEQSFTKVT